MKRLLRVLTLAILLTPLFNVAGDSSAALIPQYGTIVGTAKVVGPEFYIGSDVNETLLVNEKPSDCGHFGISKAYRTFRTKDFRGVDFNYLPKVNFRVRAKGTTTSTSSVKLRLAFGYYYYDSSTGKTETKYLATTTVPLSNSMENYSFSAITASKIPKGVHKFFYEFTKMCPSDDANCSVSISKCDGEGFYTGVKIINE